VKLDSKKFNDAASDTNERINPEQCDNGGDTDHGCDYMGYITNGWTCRHYYIGLRGDKIEIPEFRSLCKETGTD
jgi:hypothetical protein